MSDTPQENRPLQIALADVPDAGVVVTGFAGTEAISRLSRFTVSLSVPAESPVSFAQLLGKPAVVSVKQTDDEWRHFHGILSRVAQGGRSERFVRYTAELVPPLWLLTRTRRSRIFQHVTTEEIIRAVIGPLYDLSGDAVQLRGKYFPRNYTAQYRETDFDFLSRVLEEEGIYYYFTHDAEKTGVVFADSPAGHAALPGTAGLKYQPNGSGEGLVTEWVKYQELKTGRFAHTDHCFEMPTNRLDAAAAFPGSFTAGGVTHPNTWPDSAKVFEADHPGGSVRWRDGVGPGGEDRAGDLEHLFDDTARLARMRSEEELAGSVRVSGKSTFSSITAGHKFALTGHPDADGEYVVTAVTHAAGCAEAASAGSPEFAYENGFECLPLAVPFRPARTTPRPFIRGTQTAVVVGSEDAEIDPDKYGRVKVWFRWDPDGERGLDSSCWVRVAQFWAGKQWGAQFLPRVGDEVVVSFLDGDPDRPLVIGSVYNADNMPIYALPDNKTQSGIKTHSSPGGNDQHYNEIKFEDKKGAELVSVHAEKDMSTTVEDNFTVSVGAHQKDPRKAGTSTTTIFGDTKTTISKGDYYLDVATGKSDTQVKADTTVTIHEGNHTFTVSKGVVTEIFQNRQETTVKGNVDLTSAEGDIKMTAAQKVFFVQAEKEVKITSVSDCVNVYAEKEIKLVCGESSLSLKKDGTIELNGVKVTMHGSKTATVSGPDVDLTGSKSATVSGASSETMVCGQGKVGISGTMIQSKASGTHEVVGALVKIN